MPRSHTLSSEGYFNAKSASGYEVWHTDAGKESRLIPLTNRMDAAIPQTDPKRIGFRDDPNISDDLEAMARAHYSSFYFVARATLLIAYEPCIYLEDAFSLLAAATENVNRFVRV